MKIFVNGTVFILVGLDIFYRINWRKKKYRKFCRNLRKLYQKLWAKGIGEFFVIRILCPLLFPVVVCAFKLSDKIKQICAK